MVGVLQPTEKRTHTSSTTLSLARRVVTVSERLRDRDRELERSVLLAIRQSDPVAHVLVLLERDNPSRGTLTRLRIEFRTRHRDLGSKRSLKDLIDHIEQSFIAFTTLIEVARTQRLVVARNPLLREHGKSDDSPEQTNVERVRLIRHRPVLENQIIHSCHCFFSPWSLFKCIR